MLKSMTGYGRSHKEVNNREYQVEIKTVNHKYNDISIRMPRSISYLEDDIRKLIVANIKRGKIDVFITFSNYSEEGKDIRINKDLAKIYIKNLKELANDENINSNIEVTEITKLPDVLVIQNNEDEDVIKEETLGVVKDSLDMLIEMRKAEGIKMAEDMLKRIEKVEEKTKEISDLSTGLIEDYVVKLEARIKDLLKTEDIDKNRLAQEVVIYADKCSVQEEITRLNSHIAQFRDLIDNDAAVGKKLDFIIQEMNRETNTIGSKANNLEITNRVVDIKTELEDIREQIQNIE